MNDMARDEIALIISRIEASERRSEAQWGKVTKHISDVGDDVKELKVCLDKHVQTFADHVKEDTELKKMLSPIIEAKTTANSLGRFVSWLPKWVLIALASLITWLLGYKINI